MPHNPPPAPVRRILFADDQPSIREDYRKVFELAMPAETALDRTSDSLFGDESHDGGAGKFELHFAAQGEEALQMVCDALARGEPYALAFIDMRMPPGWDGVETVLRIWDEYPDLQVVICTAYSDYSWEEMVARFGGTDRLVVLKKPFDHIEVLQLAHAMTEKWRLAQEARAHTRELEWRVAERTRELQIAKEKLELEMIERSRAEEALRQAQKMEAVGALAGGIAHDFNNLLSVISGYTGLLATEKGLGPKALESLREVDDATGRAATLIRQLLTFSRKQVMTPEYFDLREIIGVAGKLLRRVIREDVALEIELGGTPMPVRADRVMIEQTILNLAVNARDAMPGAGRLSIQMALETLSAEETRARSGQGAGQFAVIRVADTGTGIAPEILPRIFDPFFTTKDVGKGSGLGLAAVYGILQQHLGWVEVTSAPGAGTTFRLYLPIVKAPVEVPPRSLVTTKIVGGTETILLVEDEAALRNAARMALQHYGYRVLTAESGAEALEVWSANAGEVSLLLTDMVMPGGISGPELAARLCDEKRGLRVVFSSGYSRELAGREKLLEDGFHFLPKPYTPAKLANSIRACLDETRPLNP